MAGRRAIPNTATGTVNLTYDLGNRVKNLTGTVTKSYAYDKLDRLTGYGTAITYQYDANGRVALGHNRSQFKNGTAISTYNNQTTSNKLTSRRRVRAAHVFCCLDEYLKNRMDTASGPRLSRQANRISYVIEESEAWLRCSV